MKKENDLKSTIPDINSSESMIRGDVPSINCGEKLYYYLGMLEDIIENEDFTENTYAKNVKIGAIKSYFDLHYKLLELQLKRETLETYKKENEEVDVEDLIKEIMND